MTTPMDRIRKQDELACLDGMIRVAHRMLEEIAHTEGLPRHKAVEQQQEIQELCDDLHGAMLFGGREAFDVAVHAAKDKPACAEFIRRLDHWLTKIPAPRIRSLPITTQQEEEERRNAPTK